MKFRYFPSFFLGKKDAKKYIFNEIRLIIFKKYYKLWRTHPLSNRILNIFDLIYFTRIKYILRIVLLA